MAPGRRLTSVVVRRQLPPAARWSGVWHAYVLPSPSIPCRCGSGPGGHGPAPSSGVHGWPERLQIRRSPRPSCVFFRLIRLVGVSAAPQAPPAGIRGWPTSTPVRLRLWRASGAAPPSSSFDSPGVPPAPVPTARICAPLRILASSGLRPPSHSSPLIFFRPAAQPRPPPCSVRPSTCSLARSSGSARCLLRRQALLPFLR